MTVQALNGTLAILAESHSREALTNTVVAPPGIVAVIHAGSNATVISGILSIAETLKVLAHSTAVAIVRALFDRAVDASAGGNACARSIRQTLSHGVAVIGATSNGAVVARVLGTAFADSRPAKSISSAVVDASTLGAVLSSPASRASTDSIVTDSMRGTVVGAELARAIRLRPQGITLALKTGGIANTVSAASVLVGGTRTLLLGAVRTSPSKVTEASSIIADSVTSAVVLALGNLAVLSSPAVLASAGSVEAVAVVANTILALYQTTVTTVVAGVAHTATTRALSFSIAVRESTQTDCARGSTKAIRTQTYSIAAQSIGAGLTLAGCAILALPSLAAEAGRIWLASSVQTALSRAHLGIALSSRPSRLTAAHSILTHSMATVNAAHMNAAVRASIEANAIALSIATLSMCRAVIQTLSLRAVASSEVNRANTLEVDTLAVSRASIRALSQGAIKASVSRIANARCSIANTVVVAIVRADGQIARCTII